MNIDIKNSESSIIETEDDGIISRRQFVLYCIALSFFGVGSSLVTNKLLKESYRSQRLTIQDFTGEALGKVLEKYSGTNTGIDSFISQYEQIANQFGTPFLPTTDRLNTFLDDLSEIQRAYLSKGSDFEQKVEEFLSGWGDKTDNTANSKELEEIFKTIGNVTEDERKKIIETLTRIHEFFPLLILGVERISYSKEGNISMNGDGTLSLADQEPKGIMVSGLHEGVHALEILYKNIKYKIKLSDYIKYNKEYLFCVQKVIDRWLNLPIEKADIIKDNQPLITSRETMKAFGMNNSDNIPVMNEKFRSTCIDFQMDADYYGKFSDLDQFNLIGNRFLRDCIKKAQAIFNNLLSSNAVTDEDKLFYKNYVDRNIPDIIFSEILHILVGPIQSSNSPGQLPLDNNDLRLDYLTEMAVSMERIRMELFSNIEVPFDRKQFRDKIYTETAIEEERMNVESYHKFKDLLEKCSAQFIYEGGGLVIYSLPTAFEKDSETLWIYKLDERAAASYLYLEIPKSRVKVYKSLTDVIDAYDLIQEDHQKIFGRKANFDSETQINPIGYFRSAILDNDGSAILATSLDSLKSYYSIPEINTNEEALGTTINAPRLSEYKCPVIVQTWLRSESTYTSLDLSKYQIPLEWDFDLTNTYIQIFVMREGKKITIRQKFQFIDPNSAAYQGGPGSDIMDSMLEFEADDEQDAITITNAALVNGKSRIIVEPLIDMYNLSYYQANFGTNRYPEMNFIVKVYYVKDGKLITKAISLSNPKIKNIIRKWPES